MWRVSYYPHEGCKTRQAMSRRGSEAKHMPLASSFPLLSNPQKLPILAQDLDRWMISGNQKEAALALGDILGYWGGQHCRGSATGRGSLCSFMFPWTYITHWIASYYITVPYSELCRLYHFLFLSKFLDPVCFPTYAFGTTTLPTQYSPPDTSHFTILPPAIYEIYAPTS